MMGQAVCGLSALVLKMTAPAVRETGELALDRCGGYIEDRLCIG